MKKIRSAILFLTLAVALLIGLGTVAFAVDYTYAAGNLEMECELSGSTASVTVTKVLGGTPEAPVEVTFPATVTIEGTEYPVTRICNYWMDCGEVIPAEYQACVSKVNVPAGINYIEGNLYSWTATKTEDAEFICEKTRSDIPDTQTVLSGIPAYVSNNYAGGALYVNECLVRVDPAYSGDFTVKPGTICILAGAFEGCDKIGAVVIPDSVEFIGMRAFANSSVTSVNLPAGLTGHSDNLTNYTFYNCNKLKTVTIGCKLGDIGLGCFQNCSNLTGFDFTKVSGKVYARAFAGAFDPIANVTLDLTTLSSESYDAYGQFAGSGIVGVKLPKIVAKTEMFRNCTKLKTVEWNTEVKAVGCRAFENCTALTADFGADPNFTALSLDYRCFANTGITEVTLPESLISIAGGVFADNEQLVTLNWTAKNLSTSTPLFAILNDCDESGCSPYMTNCTTALSNPNYCGKPEKNGHTFITTLNLLTPFTKVSSTMFAYQPYLETVNFKYEIEQVRERSFEFCPSLKTVRFEHPDKVTKIGENAFAFCPALNEFPFNTLTALKTIDTNAFLLCSDMRSAKEVSEMSGAAAGYGLSKIDLSNTQIETIGNAAFQNQIHAATLTTPATLTKAWEYAFVGNASMETVTVNGPISAFQGDYGLSNAFYVKPSDTYYTYKYNESVMPQTVGCVNDVIKTFNAPNAGMGKDGIELFVGFTGLDTVTLGKMETLKTNIFTNCVNLKTVNLPDTTTFGQYSGDNAFMNCAKLTAVNAPELTTIKGQAFIYSGIQNITASMMPKATEIPSNCFMYCNDLKNVEFSSAVSVGTNAFMNCSNLKTVKLPALVEVKERGFADSGLTELVANNLTTVKTNAFMGCANLKTVKLPALVEVKERGFAECGLEKVVVSKNVNYGAYAFQKCHQLKTVKVEEGRTELSDFMFDNCESIKTVTLPSTLKTINWAALKITTGMSDSPTGPIPRINVEMPASVTLIDDDAFANRPIDLVLMGNPFIADTHEGAPIGSNEETTISADSRIICKTGTGKAAAEDYVARAFVSDAPEIISAIEDVNVIVYYALTFNTDGGSAIGSVSGTYGEEIDLDKYVPTKDGFDFDGWYSDSALTSPIVEIKLTGNKTVYAKWIKKEPAASKLPFTDVKEADWSYEDIAYVYEKGLMQGTSETIFAPQLTATRAMIVTILWRMEGEPVVNYAMSFNDVAPDQWYTEAIRWAQANGIVNGLSTEKFGIIDPISREQMAAILYRYAQTKGAGFTGSWMFPLSFNDVQEISDYANEAMHWCVMKNIIGGVGDNLLDPQGNATREQVAAILHRFCENIVK